MIVDSVSKKTAIASLMKLEFQQKPSSKDKRDLWSEPKNIPPWEYRKKR